MKKILFISLFCVGSFALTSCTAEELPMPIENQMADDSGGQFGIPTPPPPPPPPPPGIGTNP